MKNFLDYVKEAKGDFDIEFKNAEDALKRLYSRHKKKHDTTESSDKNNDGDDEKAQGNI